MHATAHSPEAAREVALAALDAARKDFERAARAIPGEALGYRPPGEDFALGGLLVHVADVAGQYAHLVDQMRASGSEPVRQVQRIPDTQHARWIHAGFAPEERDSMLEALNAAHAEFVASVRRVSGEQFGNKVPVTFAGAVEPSPTSVEDVVGWVHAHDLEHTAQIGSLAGRWSGAHP